MSKRKHNNLSLADKAEVIKMKDQRMSLIEITKFVVVEVICLK